MIGSTMMPFSERLTLSTSRVCSSIDMFLWITPRPPSCASAIANSASVTVSIGEERIGNVERDPCGQLRLGVDLMGQQLGIARLKQHVIESDALIGNAVVHREKLRSGPG